MEITDCLTRYKRQRELRRQTFLTCFKLFCLCFRPKSSLHKYRYKIKLLIRNIQFKIVHVKFDYAHMLGMILILYLLKLTVGNDFNKYPFYIEDPKFLVLEFLVPIVQR